MSFTNPSNSNPDTAEAKIDEILNHTIYREGDGPNGSGGEFMYSYIDKSLNPNYSQVMYVPLKEKLKGLLVEAQKNAKKGWKDNDQARYLQ